MRRELTGFGEVVQALGAVQLGARRGHAIDRIEVARRRGFKLAQREFETKAAQGAVPAGSVFVSSEPLATAIIGSRGRETLSGHVTDTARPSGNWHSRVLMTETAKLSASIIPEGQPVPVEGTTAESIILDPGKIGIIVVYPEEMLADPAAVAGIEHDFGIIASRGGDTAILASLAPDSSSSFSATDAPAADVKTLLGALGDLSDIQAPILAASPNTLLTIATARDAGGWLWPEVGLQGGNMLGCPVFACDGLPDGVLRALCGEAILAKFGPIEIATSGNTSLQMATNPSQRLDTGAGSTMVSMFQSNTIAVRYTIAYAAIPLRDGCSAELVGIDW
jgi:hypothetical protein